VESLYLLTAPVTAVAGLLLVCGGLCLGTAGLLLPGGSPVRARAGAVAGRPGTAAFARVRSPLGPAPGPEGTGLRPGPSSQTATASGPGVWLGAAHAVAVIPVVLVTSVVTALWWFVGVREGLVRLLAEDGHQVVAADHIQPRAGVLRAWCSGGWRTRGLPPVRRTGGREAVAHGISCPAWSSAVGAIF